MNSPPMQTSFPKHGKLVLLIGLAGIAVGAAGINLASDVTSVKYFDNLHWSASTIAAAIFSWLCLRATPPEHVKARRWFMAGLTTFAMGQVIWDIQVAVGYSDFPGPADLFYLLLGPCIAYALLVELFRLAEPNQRHPALLDICTLTVATLTVVLAMYLPERGDTGLLALFFLIAYPVTLLTASCIGMVLTLTLRLRLSWQWVMSLVSMIAIGLFWMSWNLKALDGSAIDGSWLNVAWSVTMITAGVGLGLWQIEQSRDEKYHRVCEGLLRLLPLITVVMASLAIVLTSRLANVPAVVEGLTQIGAPLVILLAMIKQVLLLKERDQLIETQAALVHEREALRASEERFRILTTATTQMVWTATAQGELEDCPSWRALTGQSREEILGDGWVNALHPEDAERIFALWKKSFAEHSVFEASYRLRRHDGVFCHFMMRGVPVFESQGKVREWVGTCTDITEAKHSEELIWQQANFDTLTGLPNRRMFRDRLEHGMKKSDRAGLTLAFLLIDLDQFKEVNDTLGHDVGDMLLQEAARRICACVRGVDTVARLGGDEFTVILCELVDSRQAENVAQKIIDRLSEPYHLGNEVAFVSASIGITLFPNDTTEVSALMKNADQAMYVAKNKGRNCFSYFTRALQESAQARMHLTNDLRGALSAGQLSVHYQPIINLSTGVISKAEALLRWQHPVHGMISPAYFIPLAETSGLIDEIGDWVFKESARWVSRWTQHAAAGFQISVNVSPVQFNSRLNLTHAWRGYLQQAGLPEGSMVIEITEGVLLHAEPNVMEQLIMFRDSGIEVAIDDFGTGYSALSYLKKFHIDYLKIDQSFTHTLETDEDDVALCEAIIVMAHKLGLQVIAEGVETEGQKKILLEMGCDYGQGYLFARPMPDDEFVRFLERKALS